MKSMLWERPLQEFSKAFPCLFLIGLSFFLDVCGGDELSGPNVCQVQQVIFEDVVVKESVPTRIATTTWCLPKSCVVYKRVNKLVYKKEKQPKTVIIKRCCDGYIHRSDNTCIPDCLNQCTNGQCIAPRTCDCKPGFSGENCTQSCPAAKWGPQCNNDCTCKNAVVCDPFTGQCQCQDGWRGEMCHEECPYGYYGHMCQQRCRCQNEALCDRITGRCRCKLSSCGPLCERTIGCDEENGRACSKCQNGGTCVGIEDKCSCPAGWTGDVCGSPCNDGFWGKGCDKHCKICHNGGNCDPTNGVCQCQRGYLGPHCENQCNPGSYGAQCESQCDCENAQTCDTGTGKCKCYKGYKGDRCDARGCPDGLYGQTCNNTCRCSNLTTCHPLDGSCVCKKGWQKTGGPSCCICCLLNGGDSECFKDCGCTDHKYLCGPELGGCVCMPNYTGPECRASAQDEERFFIPESGNQVSLAKTDQTGLIVGLVMALLVVIAILAVAIFYRRRVRKLRQELAVVTYTANGESPDSDMGELRHVENMMYLDSGSSSASTSGIRSGTSVQLRNGETKVKLTEPLPKIPVGNMYVSLRCQSRDVHEGIYESINYESPGVRHQYASVEEANDGQTNLVFENQTYTPNGMNHAPPSYESVISETRSSTHPA